MRVLICGVDGYLGWSFSLYLAHRGVIVGGVDNFLRRKLVKNIGSNTMFPIPTMKRRLEIFQDHFNDQLHFYNGDLRQYDFVAKALSDFSPDAIIHLGEIPSAPYSMIDVNSAVFTQSNNLIGTMNLLFAIKEICPQAHLIKLGTMGEYGTPNLDIPEGFFDVEFRGRKDRLPFPRKAGSWYHWSKVHDSNNVMYACDLWGLCATDIMQGVVYGTQISEMNEDRNLSTRFDVDQCFGTVINRFCAQAAIGHPLTPFGTGSQKRGFLPLRDSMQCLNIAINNPPKAGEYRVFNQFEELYSITELASHVSMVGHEIGLTVDIRNIENPRKEADSHYYNPDHRYLLDLGYIPNHNLDAEIKIMLLDLIRNKSRIEKYKDVLIPDIRWQGPRRRSRYIDHSSG